tara:strand:- start:844 stop:1140 length:297 start_codon:yes stop_codon:yes gene_type:complete
MNDRITVESLGWIVQPTYRLYSKELDWHTVTLEEFNDLLNDENVDVRCNNSMFNRDPECTLNIKHKKGAMDGIVMKKIGQNYAPIDYSKMLVLGGEEE